MYQTMDQEAIPKMIAILQEYGLTITLRSLIVALEEVLDKRGASVEGLLILEALRGLLNGYNRRYDCDCGEEPI